MIRCEESVAQAVSALTNAFVLSSRNDLLNEFDLQSLQTTDSNSKRWLPQNSSQLTTACIDWIKIIKTKKLGFHYVRLREATIMLCKIYM